jgi:hypothetical protein
VAVFQLHCTQRGWELAVRQLHWAARGEAAAGAGAAARGAGQLALCQLNRLDLLFEI